MPTKNKLKFFLVAVTLLIAGGGAFWIYLNSPKAPTSDTAPQLPEAELTKSNLIRLSSPRPNQSVRSPLLIQGEARGNWFFEASFPVFLTDWDGRIIAQGIAQAKGDWMTTEFVPFEATLMFTVDKNIYSNRGTLILKKDNPSGLPEYDDALEIPVIFAEKNNVACTMEAKLCSDGTGVGRTGPNCEFEKCPSEK